MGPGRENMVGEAPSRSRLTSRLDIVIRHLRAIRHSAMYVCMHARVERHLYIGFYLSSSHSIPTSRHYQSRKHIVARPDLLLHYYQPNLYSNLHTICSYPRVVQTSSLCLSVQLSCGRTRGNSIENDDILGNNGIAAHRLLMCPI